MVGADIGADEKDQSEGATGVITNGHSDGGTDGYCHGSKCVNHLGLWVADICKLMLNVGNNLLSWQLATYQRGYVILQRSSIHPFFRLPVLPLFARASTV